MRPADTVTPARRSAATAVVTALRAPADALRMTMANPPLRRVQLAWAAVMVASWIVTIAISFVAFQADGSRGVAIAVLARTLPGLVVGAAVGALVDRIPRRTALVASSAAGTALCAAAASTAGPLGSVVAVGAAVSLATMLFSTAHSVVVPDLVALPGDLTAANVMASAIEAVGVFAGPALAGVLLAVHGAGLAFGVAAAMFALAALTSLGVGRSTALRVGGTPVEVPRGLLRLPVIRLLLPLLLAQTLVAGGLVVLYPALAVDVLGVELSAVGLLTAAFGLGGIVGAAGVFSLAGSNRLGWWTTWALLWGAVPLLAMPVAPGVTVVVLLLVVAGASSVLFDVTSMTLLQRGIPLPMLGRACAAVEVVAVAGLGAGAVVAPLLEAWVGSAAALTVLAAPLATVALVSAPLLRELDHALVAPTRQVELLQGSAVFALLPPLQVERLALQLQRVELRAGDVVVRQGEPGELWFVVDEGELEATVDGRVVSTLGPGDSFGEVALLHGGIRVATVGARTAAVLWELHASGFLGALSADGGPAMSNAVQVAQRYVGAAPGTPRPPAATDSVGGRATARPQRPEE